MGAPSTSSTLPLRIAICGAGIGGLALAVVLGKFERAEAPLEVNIFERHSEVVVFGAGVSVWQRTWRVMELLGLDEELSTAAERPPNKKSGPGFVYRRSDRTENNYTFCRIMMPYGASTMHRADLIKVLTNNVPERYNTYYGKKLLHYAEVRDEYGAVSHLLLHFDDGTEAEADILVGADGIRSTVRECMYDLAHSRDCANETVRTCCPRCSAATPVWDGVVCYRTLVPTEKLRKINPEHEAFTSTLCFAGKSKHVVSYPVAHGSFINVVGYDNYPGCAGSQYEGKWSEEVSKEDVAQVYEGWERDLHQLFECMDPPTRWVLNVVDGLPFCVTERVALLGDSMQAMESHLGSGAGQSIESAYILGRLLTHPLTNLAHVPEALRIYQSIRLPYGHTILRRAQATGKHCEFDAPGEYDGAECTDEPERLAALGKKLAEQWSWQWQEHFDDQWEEAEAALELTKAQKQSDSGRAMSTIQEAINM